MKPYWQDVVDKLKAQDDALAAQRADNALRQRALFENLEKAVRNMVTVWLGSFGTEANLRREYPIAAKTIDALRDLENSNK